MSGDNGDPKRQIIPKCVAVGQSRLYIFNPKDTITAADLAASVELIVFGLAGATGQAVPPMCDAIYERLSPTAKEQWVVQERPKIVPVRGPTRLQFPPGSGK